MDALIPDNWCVQLSALALVTIISAYGYVKYTYSYWKRLNVPYVEGTFPCGNLLDFFLSRLSIAQIFCKLSKQKKDSKYFGYFTFMTPGLVIQDLDLIRNVLVKDFSNFVDRGVYHDVERDALSVNLFAVDGAKWKRLRSKLSTTFSSGKLKITFANMKECIGNLENFINKKIKCSDEINFKGLIARFSLDVIANVALGITENNIENDTEFCRMAFKGNSTSFVQACRFICMFICKSFARLFRMRFSDTEVEEYFLGITNEIVSHREKTNEKRNDFMQLLIELKNSKTPDTSVTQNEKAPEPLTMREVAAQAFVFVLAGYETASTAMSFCLLELALNPDVQEKLRKEVDAKEDDISYEKINDLPYLEMVISETLRKYPPVGFVQRQCANDYRLPDGQILKSGIVVVIPTRPLHHNPVYFPDPEVFNPERFNKISPAHPIIPFSYIPFGEGPRTCIGMRFAKLEIKVTLFKLIRNYVFEVSPKTTLPPVEETRTFVFNTKGGMWLRVSKR